jgi:hypothetical protein
MTVAVIPGAGIIQANKSIFHKKHYAIKKPRARGFLFYNMMLFQLFNKEGCLQAFPEKEF